VSFFSFFFRICSSFVVGNGFLVEGGNLPHAPSPFFLPILGKEKGIFSFSSSSRLPWLVPLYDDLASPAPSSFFSFAKKDYSSPLSQVCSARLVHLTKEWWFSPSLLPLLDRGSDGGPFFSSPLGRGTTARPLARVVHSFFFFPFPEMKER